MVTRANILAAMLVCLLPLSSLGAEKETATTGPRKGDILPFKVTEKTLANGLRVIIVPTGFPDIVALHIPVQTGSRNEVEPGKSGFAHFFEHVMFRGTPNYSADQWQAIMTRAGARTNANTSDDRTDYHATFSKDDLETVLKLEADRFQNLSYSEEDFKTEARAVLGEYNKNSATPFRKLFEVQRDKFFTTHTYKHTTMGFLKDIEDMPNQFDYSKLFFKRWYAPQNTALIIAGDVNAAEVLPLVEKYWGGWKPSNFKVEIPKEPAPGGPLYTHVPWNQPTVSLVTVAFRGPAFSEREKDYAAMELLTALSFGRTSDIYKKLVVTEQKVDQLSVSIPSSIDPALVTIIARVKNIGDAVYVRDEILRTAAQARSKTLPARRVEEAKSNARYDLSRSLDNTDAIAATLVEYVMYDRSWATLNNSYRLYETLTADDLRSVAAKYFVDRGMIVTTLSQQPMPAAMATAPSLASFTPPPASDQAISFITQKSTLPQLSIKLQFLVGSAMDPEGNEGLAALAASMIAGAGSKAMTIDEITKAFYPMAASFGASVDREMTTFTGSIHRENAPRFLDIVFPMVLDPGFRVEDFQRLKDAQLNALKTDLRSTNEEELGKERLQANLFAGGPYDHPALGTVAGVTAITLDDVKSFVKSHYTLANLVVGMAGDYPEDMKGRLQTELAQLPASAASARPSVAVRKPQGLEIDIIKKETIATAISFGHPITVTRSHTDYAALSVARSWLGEHRSSSSHLYSRIREVRGMNYGDYAYIEAFPAGMFSMTPSPSVGRRAQIFEVWIRPVLPANAHMALRIALHELEKLIDNGLTQEQFEATREYLMKNVSLMTATQNQQLGYALDSKFYGTGPFVATMREQLRRLTLADVNAAIKRHLSAKDLAVVIITRDAEGLRDQLVSDEVSIIKYDAAKPEALLQEDKLIGAMKLNITPGKVAITPVEEVFAR